MSHYAICHHCKSPIPPERFYDKPIVCAGCGETNTQHSAKIQRSLSLQLTTFYIVFSILFVGSVAHVMKWDRFALEVLPLKSAQSSGTASPEQLQRVAEICSTRLLHDCTEQALRDLAQHSSHQLEAFESLATLQRLRGQKAAAMESYADYLRAGGEDFEAIFHYATLLGEAGQFEAANQYFEHLLSHRPDVLQITVTRTYVSLLKDQGNLRRAKSLIEGIRRKGGNAAQFMDNELKEINEALRVAQRVARR